MLIVPIIRLTRNKLLGLVWCFISNYKLLVMLIHVEHQICLLNFLLLSCTSWYDWLMWAVGMFRAAEYHFAMRIICPHAGEWIWTGTCWKSFNLIHSDVVQPSAIFVNYGRFYLVLHVQECNLCPKTLVYLVWAAIIKPSHAFLCYYCVFHYSIIYKL
jgi:hypothetical protein